jgi:hypothetical protein
MLIDNTRVMMTSREAHGATCSAMRMGDAVVLQPAVQR